MRVQGLQSEPVRAIKKFYLEKQKQAKKSLSIRFPETLASKHPCRQGWQYAAMVGHLQRIHWLSVPSPALGHRYVRQVVLPLSYITSLPCALAMTCEVSAATF